MKKATIGYSVIISLLVMTSLFSLKAFSRQRSMHDMLDLRDFPHKIGDWRGRDLEITERFQFKEGIHGRYSEEWELYLNIAGAGYLFGHIDKELVVVEIRKDSNTQWDKQWVIKKNTIDMLDSVFADMSGEDKELYKVDSILKRSKVKLSVAYLIAGKNKESFELLVELYPKSLVCILFAILSVIPSSFLKSLLIRQWMKKQVQSFIVLDR